MRGTITYLPWILLTLAYITAAVLFVLSSELIRSWWRDRELKTILGSSVLAGFAGLLSIALPFRYQLGWFVVLLLLIAGCVGLRFFMRGHQKIVRISVTLVVAIGIAISLSAWMSIFTEPRSAVALNRTLNTAVQTISDKTNEVLHNAEDLANEDELKGVFQSSDPASLGTSMQQLMIRHNLSRLSVADTTSRVLARGHNANANDFLIQTEAWTVNSVNGDSVSGIARTSDGHASIVASTGVKVDGLYVGMVSTGLEMNTGFLESLSKDGQAFALFSTSGLVSEGGTDKHESLLLTTRALENTMQNYLQDHPKSGQSAERYLLDGNDQYRLVSRTLGTFTGETLALVLMQPINPPSISPTASTALIILVWTLLGLLAWAIIQYREHQKKGGRHA